MIVEQPEGVPGVQPVINVRVSARIHGEVIHSLSGREAEDGHVVRKRRRCHLGTQLTHSQLCRADQSCSGLATSAIMIVDRSCCPINCQYIFRQRARSAPSETSVIHLLSFETKPDPRCNTIG